MTENDRQNQIAEARMYASAAPVLFPLLQKRQELALLTLIGSFRGGETNLVGIVAELASLHALQGEIKRKIDWLEQQKG